MYRRWTEFTGAPNKFRKDTPHVTLSPKGVFLMNRIAHEMFGAPEAVKFFYDKPLGVVGLLPTEVDEPNAFPVKGKDQNKLVHAKPFLRNFNIETDRTVVFNRVDHDDGMLILDMGMTTAIGRRVAR